MKSNKVTFWLGLALVFAIAIGAFGPVLAEIRTGAGVMPRDKQSHDLQCASALKYEDATGTPKVSPAATSSSSLTLTVPENATYLHLKGVAAIYFGEGTLAGSTTGNGYCSASAGEWVAIPCSGVSTVKVLAQSGDTTIHFFFEMLNGK